MILYEELLKTSKYSNNFLNDNFVKTKRILKMIKVVNNGKLQNFF